MMHDCILFDVVLYFPGYFKSSVLSWQTYKVFNKLEQKFELTVLRYGKKMFGKFE